MSQIGIKTIAIDQLFSLKYEGELDRRASGRFPFQEAVSYHVMSRVTPVSGQGLALNISSGGMLFTTRSKLALGRLVKVVVSWPVVLGGRGKLYLIAVSRVVRSQADSAAVRFQRYEFSTENPIDTAKTPDRRASSRFPIRQAVSYRVVHSGMLPIQGLGLTLNIGSGGVLFTTHQKLEVGCAVKLAMNWPARLDGTCPLRLVALGRLIRAEEGCAAVRFHHYDFRTGSVDKESKGD